MTRRREICRVDPKDVDLGDVAELSNSMVLDHLTPKVQEPLAEEKNSRYNINTLSAGCMKSSVVYLTQRAAVPSK